MTRVFKKTPAPIILVTLRQQWPPIRPTPRVGSGRGMAVGPSRIIRRVVSQDMPADNAPILPFVIAAPAVLLIYQHEKLR